MKDFIEMVIIPIGIVFLIIAVLLWIVNALIFQPQLELQTNWSNLCRENGGHVEVVNSSQWECFKDGKIILHIN